MKKIWIAMFMTFCLLLPAFAVGTAVAADQVAAAVGASVNLNQADTTELQNLPGVGPALAERIVSFREANGPFQTVDQLTDVPGIGAKKLEKMRGHLRLQ